MSTSDPRSHTYDNTVHHLRPYPTYSVNFTSDVNVTSTLVGAEIVSVSDDFFASAENLLNPNIAVWKPEAFSVNGKWMDGWESRRKRDLSNNKHDWCVIKLGVRTCITGFDVDTANFTGNYPDHCIIEAVDTYNRNDVTKQDYEFNNDTQQNTTDKLKWTRLTGRIQLQGGSHNYVSNSNVSTPFTHVRLHIFPDGGVARFRVYGHPQLDLESIKRQITADSSYQFNTIGLVNGSRVIAASNSYFGPKDNLILPNSASCMGEGWESKRSRREGHDWVIIKTAVPSHINTIEIDTAHFKGNFPDKVSIDVTSYGYEANSCSSSVDTLLPYDLANTQVKINWTEMLPQEPMKASSILTFKVDSEKGNKTNRNNLYVIIVR